MLDLTISGALAVKEAFPDDTVTVFLLPPSLEELRKRLQLRGRESQEQIEKRIETAISDEIPQVYKFDNIIVNDVVSVAGAELLAIIKAEKLKYKRNQEIINELGLKGEN
jgi:guanylate kinase